MNKYLIMSALSVLVVLAACQKQAKEKEAAAKSELDSLKKSSAFQEAQTKKENQAFLEANKTKEGVMTTASGLQYSVLQLADGVKPAANDKVVVKTKGSLINGTVIQDSGAPDTLSVADVIPGLSEALQLMSKGSKFKVFVPASLAYGEKGSGDKIGPHATLIYELELVEIIKPMAAVKKADPAVKLQLQKAKKQKQKEKMKLKKAAKQQQQQ